MYVLKDNSKFVLINSFIFFSKASESGSHWFVIFRESDETCEIFEPLGSGNIRSLLSIIPRYCRHIEVNQEPVQSKTSTRCGEFCLFFILHRFYNLDLDFSTLINSIFSVNLERNESQVLQHLS